MFRSIGAFGFGIMSDRYGRRLPIIIVLSCLAALQIGLGFVQAFKQFLAVRALFGISMGGLFGPACAFSLEDAPPEAHVVFEQGYPFGYILVVCFQRAITYNSSHTWRALFWFFAGPSVIFIIWVALIGETETFSKHTEAINAQLSNSSTSKTKLFFDESKSALKKYWLICIYLIFLMAGFKFASHGSQDLYPTMLTKELGYGANRSTVTNSVANLGAITGEMVIGHLSSFFGRRFMIVVVCIIGGALICPWAFVRNSGINASVFFLQFMVLGAWGVVPTYLSEVSPPKFRAIVSGLAYQLSNLASSASSTIETTIGERFPKIDSKTGLPIKGVYTYSKVMAIFVGCVFGYLIIMTLLGPENSSVILQIVDSDDDLKYSFSSSSDGEDIEKV